MYSDKVENRAENLADAIGDSDTKFMNLLVTENETVCDKEMPETVWRNYKCEKGKEDRSERKIWYGSNR